MAQRRFGTPGSLLRRVAAFLAAATLAAALAPGTALADSPASTDGPGPYRLSGTVSGSDGTPLDGILIRAKNTTEGGTWETTTGTDGSYSLGVTSGTYLLGINVNGDHFGTYCGNGSWGQDCSAAIEVNGADVSVNITIGDLSGTVTGSDGSPAAGLTIHAMPGGEENPATSWVGDTASDGTFLILVPPGSYSLLLPSGCYASGQSGNFSPGSASPCTLVTDGTTGIEISLGATATPTPAPTPEPTATVSPSPTPTSTVGPATQISVETAPDGSGTVVPAQTLTLGSSLKVYAISRDAAGRFVARVDATWGLSERSGGVAPTDLWGPSGGGYAILFGNSPGSAVIRAVRGDLTPVDSGVITISPFTGSTLTAATPTGTGVAVSPLTGGGGSSGISLTFADVSAAGATSVAVSNAGPSLTGGFRFQGSPIYYEISTTAIHSGAITLCLPYDPSVGLGWLLHWNGTGWDNVASPPETPNGTICGSVSSLSPFVVAQQLSASAASPNSGPDGSTSGSISGGLAAGLLLVLVLLAAVVVWWLIRRRKADRSRHADLNRANETEPEGG